MGLWRGQVLAMLRPPRTLGGIPSQRRRRVRQRRRRVRLRRRARHLKRELRAGCWECLGTGHGLVGAVALAGALAEALLPSNVIPELTHIQYGGVGGRRQRRLGAVPQLAAEVQLVRSQGGCMPTTMGNESLKEAVVRHGAVFGQDRSGGSWNLLETLCNKII